MVVGDQHGAKYCVYQCPRLARRSFPGQTHIILRQIEFVSESLELKYTFRDELCGVHKIDDVLPDIEAALSLERGKGRQHIDGVLKEIATNAREGAVPILFYTCVPGVATMVGGSEFGLGFLCSRANLSEGAAYKALIRTSPYDPNRREHVNKPGDKPPRNATKIRGLKKIT